MAITILLLGLLTLLVWLTARLVDTVRHDGLGHRPPPPSRHDWTEGSRLR
ncbi:hypothetical protein [Cellulomonas sp. ES6]|nr:hypothetical protein [Cellulomonas sp. ES6]WHP17303.1 hypothetical protein P9841_17235 [Cellulomonas sp. ES6]